MVEDFGKIYKLLRGCHYYNIVYAVFTFQRLGYFLSYLEMYAFFLRWLSDFWPSLVPFYSFCISSEALDRQTCSTVSKVHLGYSVCTHHKTPLAEKTETTHKSHEWEKATSVSRCMLYL